MCVTPDDVIRKCHYTHKLHPSEMQGIPSRDANQINVGERALYVAISQIEGRDVEQRFVQQLKIGYFPKKIFQRWVWSRVVRLQLE